MSESAYDWEREERRDAIRAAEDAGEIDDRPSASDLFDFGDEDRPWEGEEEVDDER